jgi:hypothetical protein
VVYQNINSLWPKTVDKWKATLEQIEFLRTDIIGLRETCINWNNNTTMKIYSNTLQKQFNKVTFLASKVPKYCKLNKINLPGGTVSLTVNGMVHYNETYWGQILHGALDGKHIPFGE